MRKTVVRMRKTVVPTGLIRAAAGLAIALACVGCDASNNPLAPYEGSRPLIIQQMTRSFAPDIQWVGGRVAAVGINRGNRAALDSTLVWMNRAAGNDIGSPISVRDALDRDAVTDVGGTPLDSLRDGATYTLWLAEQSALDAGLPEGGTDELAFADTTLTLQYLLRGRSGGGVDVEFVLYRDQRLTSDRYVVSWTPSSQEFRQIAIRNATLGGFTNLLWHVSFPEEQEQGIASPLAVGSVPDGGIVATPWAGFAEGSHVLWTATEDWDGDSFGFTTDGYAFFQIFASNFE